MYVLWIKVDVSNANDTKRAQNIGQIIDTMAAYCGNANRNAKGMHGQDEQLRVVGEPRWGGKLGREGERLWRKTRCIS
jgi:hypothetical protein